MIELYRECTVRECLPIANCMGQLNPFTVCGHRPNTLAFTAFYRDVDDDGRHFIYVTLKIVRERDVHLYKHGQQWGWIHKMTVTE